MTTFKTVITGYTRFPNTPDGNPRWTVETDAGNVYATNPDSSVGYVINDQRHPTLARLTLDGSGRLCGLEYAED